jgi:colanic acid/amylovoran biosynthesis protein
MQKILIINQYAGNKGDRAVLFALCRLLISNNKNIQITVSTTDPSLWNDYSYYKDNNIVFIASAWDYKDVKGFWQKRYFSFINRFIKYSYTILRENYLTLQFPIERFLVNPSFYDSAKKSDIIISTGGHHYTTILSKDLVSHLPFELCSALSLNENTIIFSQSLGPFKFHNKRNEKFIRNLLNDCKNIFIREKDSFKYLEGFQVNTEHLGKVPETVISLSTLFDKYVNPLERDKKVGVAIYSTKKRTNEEKNNYINSLAEFCNYLINLEYHVEFFPMEIKDTEPDDRRMIKEIVSKISNKEKYIIHDKDLETEQHIKAVAKCRFFVGHKTHSVVFALTSGTPLIAIEYHPKTRNFMDQFDIERYSINDEILTFDLLKDKFTKLSVEVDQVGKHCFGKALKFSKELETQVNKLL